MSRVLRFFQRIIGTESSRKAAVEAFGPDLSRFAVGDRVLIGGKRLTGPLSPNETHNLRSGCVRHSDIIGKPSTRSYIRSDKGEVIEVAYPSLENYVSLAPRKVTPVYASYASLIVSLLDFHVAPPSSTNAPPSLPPVEILESGTGHGSLTLHLARAICAANPPPPSSPPTSTEWPAWRDSRRAILHSVEISQSHSAHAQKLIRGFRQGIYWPHIDFHIASVTDWVREQILKRKESSFLSYVLLDMPDVSEALPQVHDAMKEDATVVVFVPSVTQVGECVQVIARQKLPLVLDKVVELGEGISNGRVWDVRLAWRRKGRNLRQMDSKSQLTEAEKAVPDTVDGLRDAPEENAGEEPVMVCRPLVGRALTMGGGFIGMWRKRTKVPGKATEDEVIRNLSSAVP